MRPFTLHKIKIRCLVFTMKNQKHGVRAWMVESWHGGEDEPHECLEVRRQVFLDRSLAHRAYDRICLADTLRKAVLSEIDIIPDHVLRKTVTV